MTLHDSSDVTLGYWSHSGSGSVINTCSPISSGKSVLLSRARGRLGFTPPKMYW